MGSDGIYGGKAKSKRCVFRYFLKVATELAGRTDSGRLFQNKKQNAGEQANLGCNTESEKGIDGPQIGS